MGIFNWLLQIKEKRAQNARAWARAHSPYSASYAIIDEAPENRRDAGEKKLESSFNFWNGCIHNYYEAPRYFGYNTYLISEPNYRRITKVLKKVQSSRPSARIDSTSQSSSNTQFIVELVLEDMQEWKNDGYPRNH